MVWTFEKSYTFDVRISGGSVIVKLQGQKGSDDSHVYSIGLQEIESVSDEVLSLDWIPAYYAARANSAQSLTFKKAAQSPVVARRVLYTEGQFINPVTHNPAFLHYKHGDQCVTITLKEPRNLAPGGKVGAAGRASGFKVKEFSFEVEDKAAVRDLILKALNPK